MVLSYGGAPQTDITEPSRRTDKPSIDLWQRCNFQKPTKIALGFEPEYGAGFDFADGVRA